MAFSESTARPWRPALAILLAAAVTLPLTGATQADEGLAAARPMPSGERQAEGPRLAGLAVLEDRGAAGSTVLAGVSRFGGGFSPGEGAPELGSFPSESQLAFGALVIILLGLGVAVMPWRRTRRAGQDIPRARSKPSSIADGSRRPESPTTPCADAQNVNAHEQLVRGCSEQLAYLGHELRTPVTAVVGMADSLSRADLPPDQQRCVDTILSSCDALTSVVDSFLDFSRIQSDTLVLDTGDFDLRQVVEDALDMLSYSAHSKDLELEALIESDVPAALHGDAARLRQVLVNLLGNAVKFTESGHVFLRVSCNRRKRGVASLRFDVCDTGYGVSHPKRSAIFEAFVRADVPEGQLRSGIGLGLYIAKVLVRKMGGEIGVDGATGVGSTFWFTANFDEQTEAPRATPSTLPVARALPVLIVDDSPLIRRVLTRYTEDYAMCPLAVANCTDALDALRKAAANRNPFELVFIDADMDGFEIMRLIETVREDESLSTPELVMLKSLGNGLDPIVAALLGQCRELAKPLKQSQVEKTLHAALDDSRDTHQEELPTAVNCTEATAIATHDTGSCTAAGNRLRILLAEDNPVTVEAVSRLLRDVGCDVDVATDGRAAIHAARQTNYDAIFMDFQMPGLDGCQASREIRRHEGDAPLTPIIALTADAPENIRELCLRAGMIDYLFKPVRARQLQAVLSRHCRPERPSTGDDLRSASGEVNPVAVDRLRTLFLEDSQSRLREMRQAAREGDWDTIAREAHGLAGSAGVVGATGMSSACRSLEAMARSEDPDPLAALDEVETEFEQVRAGFAEPSEPTFQRCPGIDQDQRVDGTTA
jgi:CheY-like chemotaxis protein